MPERKILTKKIVDEILSFNCFTIDEKRTTQILDFIYSVINGDNPTQYLIIEANLTENKAGIIVYILTNIRLIKIDIDQHEIKSNSFLLDKLISIERKLLDNEKAEIMIHIENSAFGLRYTAGNEKITNFFQQLEQYKIKGIP